MRIIIVADFPVNPKEDREMVIQSLMEDIGDAGFCTDDVLDDGKSDPTFIINGKVPMSITWKNKKDKLSFLTKAAIDSEWLREFKIREIREDLSNRTD